MTSKASWQFVVFPHSFFRQTFLLLFLFLSFFAAAMRQERSLPFLSLAHTSTFCCLTHKSSHSKTFLDASPFSCRTNGTRRDEGLALKGPQRPRNDTTSYKCPIGGGGGKIMHSLLLPCIRRSQPLDREPSDCTMLIKVAHLSGAAGIFAKA